MNTNILINRNFFLMWSGKAISQTGDKFYAIALAWWILQKTNSPAVMGFYMAAAVLPGLILGPFAGALIDRYSRKTILVAADIARGVVVAVPACLSAAGTLELWHLFAAAVVISAASAFFDPAAQAVTPQIVPAERLAQANSLNQMLGACSMILGPALGAALVGFFGFTAVFAINAVSYFISALFEAFMNISSAAAMQDTPVKLRDDILIGFAFLKKHKQIMIVISVIGIAHFFMGSLMVALPFLAKQLRGNSVQQLGNMEMLLGLGMFIGSAYTHLKSKASHKDSRLFLFLVIMGAGYICIGVTNLFAVAFPLPYLLLMLIIGLAVAGASVFWQTMLQLYTPNHLGGRVFSISSLAGNASMPLSYCVFGMLLDSLPLKYLMIISGSGLILVSLLLLQHYTSSLLMK